MPMDIKSLLDEHRLDDAIAEATARVRSHPTDLPARTLLFELLCFAGLWDRALKQLDAVDQQGQDPASTLGTRVYRSLIAAEKSRADLFERGVAPHFVLSPPESVTLALEALEMLRLGRPDEASDRADRSEGARVHVRGRAGDQPFDDLRDADDLLASALEVFAPTGYCWIPWEHLQFLEVEPPRFLRDLLWLPAKLATFDGQMGEVHLPCLYPGSSTSDDPAIRLGRATSWTEKGGRIMRGVGRKLILHGDQASTPETLPALQCDPA